MPKQNDYVVKQSEESNLYLTGIIQNPFPPDSYVWGTSEAAIGYETLQEAKDMATSIGGGTVGTTRP